MPDSYPYVDAVLMPFSLLNIWMPCVYVQFSKFFQYWRIQAFSKSMIYLVFKGTQIKNHGKITMTTIFFKPCSLLKKKP